MTIPLYRLPTGRYAGFLNDNGVPVFTEAVRYGAAVSSMGSINYDSISSRLVLKDASGGISALMDTRGYPFFSGKRLFVLSTDRLSLKEFSRDGDLIWARSFPSMVTTCSADNARVLVGSLNGDFQFIDRNGEAYLEYRPEGGRISAAYGSALDSSGVASLLVAGADPQTAYLLEEHGGELQERLVLPLKSDLRRNLQASYILESLFSLEQENGLLIVDTVSLNQRILPLSGRLWRQQGVELGKLIVALTLEEKYRISVVGAYSDYRGELTVPGSFSDADIEVRDNRLFLFLDDTVLVYSIKRV